MLLEEEITKRIIGACIEVHRHLGPGLLESAYEHCLCHELALQGIRFRRQAELPVVYKGNRVDCGYRIDLIVEECVIVELKSIEDIVPIHEAQLLSYLKLSGIRVGLLINFNVKKMVDGITRRVI